MKKMNKQPFYHNFTINLTATRELSGSEITEALKKIKDVLPDVDIKYLDVEAGDPADLM